MIELFAYERARGTTDFFIKILIFRKLLVVEQCGFFRFIYYFFVSISFAECLDSQVNRSAYLTTRISDNRLVYF